MGPAGSDITGVLTELVLLGKTAVLLDRRARMAGARAGPGLLVLTDPVRAPDARWLDAVAPPAAGLVLRGFGRPMSLDGIGPERTCLVTGLPRLARTLGADGLHWPNRRLRLRRRCAVRELVETASAHSTREGLRALRAGIGTVLVSAVFASRSPSAGRPLGPVRLAGVVRTLRRVDPGVRVLALGGVTARTARRLAGTGVAGVAGVGVAADGAAARQDRPVL